MLSKLDNVPNNLKFNITLWFRLKKCKTNAEAKVDSLWGVRIKNSSSFPKKLLWSLRHIPIMTVSYTFNNNSLLNSTLIKFSQLILEHRRSWFWPQLPYILTRAKQKYISALMESRVSKIILASFFVFVCLFSFLFVWKHDSKWVDVVPHYKMFFSESSREVSNYLSLLVLKTVFHFISIVHCTLWIHLKDIFFFLFAKY